MTLWWFGKQHNHKDHDAALTNLLETARRCNTRLNFDKLQYKKTKIDFFRETYTTDGHKPAKIKVSAIVEMPPPTCKKASTIIYRYGHLPF